LSLYFWSISWTKSTIDFLTVLFHGFLTINTFLGGVSHIKEDKEEASSQAS
jgi:hypothetical protein